MPITYTVPKEVVEELDKIRTRIIAEDVEPEKLLKIMIKSLDRLEKISNSPNYKNGHIALNKISKWVNLGRDYKVIVDILNTKVQNYKPNQPDLTVINKLTNDLKDIAEFYEKVLEPYNNEIKTSVPYLAQLADIKKVIENNISKVENAAKWIKRKFEISNIAFAIILFLFGLILEDLFNLDISIYGKLIVFFIIYITERYLRKKKFKPEEIKKNKYWNLCIDSFHMMEDLLLKKPTVIYPKIASLPDTPNLPNHLKSYLSY